MCLQIVKSVEVGLGVATFKFNILTSEKGIQIWLTDYELKNGKKRIKKWAKK